MSQSKHVYTVKLNYSFFILIFAILLQQKLVTSMLFYWLFLPTWKILWKWHIYFLSSGSSLCKCRLNHLAPHAQRTLQEVHI